LKQKVHANHVEGDLRRVEPNGFAIARQMHQPLFRAIRCRERNVHRAHRLFFATSTWSGDSGDADPLVGKPVAYGFGWYLDPYRGRPRMWHYGDTVGFKSAIERFPDDRLTVIVLSNCETAETARIALGVAGLYAPALLSPEIKKQL